MGLAQGHTDSEWKGWDFPQMVWLQQPGSRPAGHTVCLQCQAHTLNHLTEWELIIPVGAHSLQPSHDGGAAPLITLALTSPAGRTVLLSMP